MPSLRRSLVRILRLPVLRQISVLLLQLWALFFIVPSQKQGKFTVMQVGGRGGADPYTKWLRSRGAVRTIGVEPESSGLKKLLAQNAYDHIIPHGLGDMTDSALLHITKAKGWCSILKPDEAAIRRIATAACIAARPYEVMVTETIQLTTFDAISNTVPPVDYLQIDVQGFELNVLRGAVKALPIISVVELEIRFYPLYEKEPLFTEIHEFFTKHGFILFQMTRQGETEFGGNFVEANACYYNAGIAQSRPKHMEKMMRYAQAKHDLYGSSVLRLLGDIR